MKQKLFRAMLAIVVSVLMALVLKRVFGMDINSLTFAAIVLIPVLLVLFGSARPK